MLAESVNEAFGSTICLKNNLLRVLIILKIHRQSNKLLTFLFNYVIIKRYFAFYH